MIMPIVRLRSRRVVWLAIFGFLLFLPLLWSSGVSSAASPQSEGLFTAAQATRGGTAYGKSCAECHGMSLEGKTSVALKGNRFISKWADGKHSVDDLYFVIRTQMPYGAPGTLSNQQYIDIVAFVLQNNGYRTGNKEMSPTDTSLKTKVIAADQSSAADVGKKVETAAPTGDPAATASRPSTVKPTQAELNAAAKDTDWLMSNHDYGGQRFSDLKQINRQNVASLRPVAMYQGVDTNPFHTNPVVASGVMYITVKNSTIALDAVTLKLKWRTDRKPKGKEGWPMNRGVAIRDGMVIRGTHDGYLVAMNAETGKVVWERALVDMTKNEGGFTMAPVIWEDLIIIGPAGSELGVKGWVGAFKLSNGEPVWRFNTVPDDGEPGSETWEKADAKLIGGGAVWAPLSLDTEAGIVYVPVANPAPDFYGEARPGNNLYTCSMVALNARTGKLNWFYQLVPHDEHDWDTTQASPLFTTTIAGKSRKLVATSGKDGLLHVLDRENHQKVYEVPITTRLNTDKPPTREGLRACPGVLGGVQWNGPAFNPGTNMLYVNSVDWCGSFNKAADVRYVEGAFYMGGGVNMDPPQKSRGWLNAVDASTGAVRWKYESSRPMLAAVTTTSANLIFTGELLGDFMALDGKTGEVLYRFNTGGRLNGGVITYAVNGKQYVAVASGAANGFWAVPPGSATIIVFGLPSDSAGGTGGNR
ncbi:MAG TPA: PQQ-binding-like beta-propeller repeat protein [Blastocatellia bacterium]|nr:PQQ-binding-like beta-propeller repeat protein [Blastocatellia bacterium]